MPTKFKGDPVGKIGTLLKVKELSVFKSANDISKIYMSRVHVEAECRFKVISEVLGDGFTSYNVKVYKNNDDKESTDANDADVDALAEKLRVKLLKLNEALNSPNISQTILEEIPNHLLADVATQWCMISKGTGLKVLGILEAKKRLLFVLSLVRVVIQDKAMNDLGFIVSNKDAKGAKKGSGLLSPFKLGCGGGLGPGGLPKNCMYYLPPLGFLFFTNVTIYNFFKNMILF